MLRLAIPNKGRLVEETRTLLERIGVRVRAALGRALVQTSTDGRVQILHARAQDIPEYVETGAADVGVTGLDLVEETGVKVERLVDLGFGHCRLVVAAPEDARFTTTEEIPAGTRVATPFPSLARRHFERAGRPVQITPISGAAEIAPSIGVADAVVDLTDTGATLRQNRLRLLDIVMDSWAVLIGNPQARRAKSTEVETFVAAVRSVLEANPRRYLMANVPRRKLRQVVRILPGLAAPTVMNLALRTHGAVHAVVHQDEINDLIPRLQKAGATGILVLPIERLVP